MNPDTGPMDPSQVQLAAYLKMIDQQLLSAAGLLTTFDNVIIPAPGKGPEIINPTGVRYHEYRTVYVTTRVTVSETLCFGKWYTTGSAPCELMEADAREAALAELPPCSIDDEAAIAELLQLPTVSVCVTKGRASWQDK